MPNHYTNEEGTEVVEMLQEEHLELIGAFKEPEVLYPVIKGHLIKTVDHYTSPAERAQLKKDEEEQQAKVVALVKNFLHVDEEGTLLAYGMLASVQASRQASDRVAEFTITFWADQDLDEGLRELGI